MVPSWRGSERGCKLLDPETITDYPCGARSVQRCQSVVASATASACAWSPLDHGSDIHHLGPAQHARAGATSSYSPPAAPNMDLWSHCWTAGELRAALPFRMDAATSIGLTWSSLVHAAAQAQMAVGREDLAAHCIPHSFQDPSCLPRSFDSQV